MATTIHANDLSHPAGATHTHPHPSALMACTRPKSPAVTSQEDDMPENRGTESPELEHGTAVLPLQASYHGKTV